MAALFPVSVLVREAREAEDRVRGIAVEEEEEETLEEIRRALGREGLLLVVE